MCFFLENGRLPTFYWANFDYKIVCKLCVELKQESFRCKLFSLGLIFYFENSIPRVALFGTNMIQILEDANSNEISLS